MFLEDDIDREATRIRAVAAMGTVANLSRGVRSLSVIQFVANVIADIGLGGNFSRRQYAVNYSILRRASSR